MEQTVIFEEKVSLSPLDIRAEITSFDDILLKKLKASLEGRCSKHGFVLRDSLQVVSRSLGMFEKGCFTGDAIFWIKAQGRVYNPPEGFQIEGEVIRKNKMGLYMLVEDAIRIMVPRDLHIGSVDFDKVEMGDRILVEIKKSRFQINDSHILSIGQFIRKVGGPARAGAAAALAAALPVVPVLEGEEEGDLEGEQETEEEAVEEEGGAEASGSSAAGGPPGAVVEAAAEESEEEEEGEEEEGEE